MRQLNLCSTLGGLTLATVAGSPFLLAVAFGRNPAVNPAVEGGLIWLGGSLALVVLAMGLAMLGIAMERPHQR